MQHAVAKAAAPWKEVLQKALKKNSNVRHSKYMQVATVRPDGRPANRTVVYRGFLGESDKLTFVTDSRSKKVEDLAHNPWAEVAWYFPDSREQFRLLGRLTVVAHDCEDAADQKARLIAWKNMSDPGRQQFLWPHPGLPRDPDSTGAFTPTPPGKEDPVADAFCLVYMQVEEVDHLHLAKNKRHVYRRAAAPAAAAAAVGESAAGGAAAEEAGAGWTTEFVNP